MSCGASASRVVALRSELPKLCCVRRLPPWLCGVFHPWGEQHTYYADGSFDYQRQDALTKVVNTVKTAIALKKRKVAENKVAAAGLAKKHAAAKRAAVWLDKQIDAVRQSL